MATFKIKKTKDGAIELYESEISFSPEDKNRVLNDLPAFLKGLLEEQGHKVNRVVVTTNVEKCVVASATKGEGVLKCRKVHIQLPEEERSTWIWDICE